MNKQIAFAYGIAGLAVAVALITVVSTSAGLFGGKAAEAPPDEPATTTSAETQQASMSVPQGQQANAPIPQPVYAPQQLAAVPAAQQPVEVVYVDEPAPRRRHEDDERYEDDEHEEHEYREHEEYEEHEEEDDD